MSRVRIRRAYDPRSAEDGFRVLVDRLWPRGLKRSEAGIDAWLKGVAPSTELRRWFGHDPAKWAEFQRRYRAELAGNAALAELRDLVHGHEMVTLVFAAHDAEHNNAVVLQDLIGSR